MKQMLVMPIFNYQLYNSVYIYINSCKRYTIGESVSTLTQFISAYPFFRVFFNVGVIFFL